MSLQELHELKCRSREVIDLLSGKWTLDVLLLLKQQPWRYGELNRHIGGVSKKVLTQRLRDLERAGLVRRYTLENSNVVGVEYSLTGYGKSLISVICHMRAWAEENMDRVKHSMAHYDGEGARSGHYVLERPAGSPSSGARSAGNTPAA